MKNNWSFVIILCLGLGLAPWWLNGEPHIFGKVKWLLGGAEGMKFMDWFDLILHGLPWLILVWKVINDFVFKRVKKS